MLNDSIEQITLQKLKKRHQELGQFVTVAAKGPWGVRFDLHKTRACYIYSNITPIESLVVRETSGFEPYEVGANATDFRPIKVGESWGAGVETGWLKLNFTLPESFAGKPAVALLELGMEGLAYLDGKPYQGLDVNHQEILLSESAEAGKTYELVVEGRPGPFWLGGRDAATVKRADIATVNREVEKYWYALGFLTALAEQLPTTSPRRAKIIFGLNESMKLLDMNSSDENTLRESAVRAYKAIEPLLDKKANASDIELTCCGHSHIDTAWLWPYAETVRKCSRTFSTVMRLMEQYPDYHFSQSQPQLYEFTKETYPSLYGQIKERAKEGRWEPIGAMWVEPDTNVPSGESLVRQCLYGKRFFMSEFGLETDTLWLPDVFGYSAALPQILKKAGVDYFTTVKLGWNQFNQIPYSSFWWQGIDGSKVLSHFPPYSDYNSPIVPESLLWSQKNYKEKDRSNHALQQFGHGDGGGGPERQHLEHLKLAKDLEGLPKCVQRPARDFFADLKAESETFPTWRGELYFERHRGTYTTQARTKLNNRKNEFLLRDAEMLSSVALLLGGVYPQSELDTAWKLLLKNQFHDVIPGSSVAEVYEDADADHAEVREIAGKALDAAISRIVSDVDTSGEGTPVVVFNTLSIPRASVVEMPLPGEKDYVVIDANEEEVSSQISEDGTRISFLAYVPDCGYSTFHLVEASESGSLGGTFDTLGEGWDDDDDDLCGCGCGHDHHDHERERMLVVTPKLLENDYFRITLDERGLIISVYDKVALREVVQPGMCANLLQLHEDKPIDWEAWDVDYFAYESCDEITDLSAVEVVESGPLVGSLWMERKFGTSTLEQRIVIYADSPRIDFITDVDWQERQKLLKVAFPVEINSPTARYEIQFGNVERPTHASTSWDFAKFEVCGHKWAELSEGNYGVSLLNDCKYGYDIRDNVMRLSLLRGPIDPDPLADIGRHTFTYSLYPHSGDYLESGVVWMGYDLNVPLRAVIAESHTGKLPAEASWISIDAPHVVLDTIKKAEDDDSLIVRLYEAHNQRGDVTMQTGFPLTKATECDLMERETAKLDSIEGSVDFSMTPFEIKTVKLEFGKQG